MPRRKLPIDFEKKVKQAPPANGSGYPYQISAKDLMENFKFLNDIVPDAEAGDMIYHDGDKYVLLKAPSGGQNNILGHDGTKPEYIIGGQDMNMRGVGANIIATESGGPDENTTYIFTIFPNPHHILAWRKGVFVGRFDVGEEPAADSGLVEQDYIFTYVDGPS